MTGLSERLDSVRLLLLDIDGTLVTGPQIALESVSRQLARLRPLGVRFSIATGRTICGAVGVVEALRLGTAARSVIAYNGAVLGNVDSAPWLERTLLSTPDARAILEHALSRGLVPLVYRCRQHFDLLAPESVVAQVGTWEPERREFNRMVVTLVADLPRTDLSDAVAILLSPARGVSSITSHVESIRSVSSPATLVDAPGSGYIEIRSASSSKLIAARTLARRFDLDPAQVMAIGDSYNDLSLIGAVGCGVAVANSPEELKAVAAYTCRRVGPAGVVEALRLLADHLRRRRMVHRVNTGQ